MGQGTVFSALTNPMQAIGSAIGGNFQNTFVGQSMGFNKSDNSFGLGSIINPANLWNNAAKPQNIPTPPPPGGIDSQTAQADATHEQTVAQGQSATQLSGNTGADTTLATTYSAGRTLLGS